MTLNEIIEYVGQQATTLLLPGYKAVFKEKLDPYFKQISAFRKKLAPHIVELKKEIDKYYKEDVKSELLNMDKQPAGEYIKCSNEVVRPPYFDIYCPQTEWGHIWGWMPENAYRNEPLRQLLSYANYWGKPEEKNMTLFQFAIVAIIHDALRLENGCKLIYFGSGDDFADRVASKFMHKLSENTNSKVLNRLKNAVDSVMIELENCVKPGGKAGDEKHSTNNDTGWVFKTGQVLYNDVDLDVAGFRLDILKRLVEAEGGVITHNALKGITERYKHYIGELRGSLAKNNIPYEIKTVTGEGYKLTAY